MAAVIQALPLGVSKVAQRVIGRNANSPGVSSFIQAGHLLRDAENYGHLHEATDALGQAAQDTGLDHFKQFLREADDNLTQTGGMTAILREMPKPASVVSATTNQLSMENQKAEKNLIIPTGAEGSTVPPPDNIPGGPWKWSSDPRNDRGGKFIGSNGASASWDAVDGHWDVDNGQNERTRYNRFGAALTPKEAHGPYKGPPRIPLPFRLFKMVPPLFILPEQTKEALEPNSA